MKGVILAGGKGTRLYPLTFATNKHLLPVFDKPMIYYPIQTLVKAGICDILIVTGGPHAGHFLRVLKNGEGLGVRHLSYAYQENEGGIADALRLAEDFADDGPLTVLLGDNCTDADIAGEVKKFKDGAMVFLKEVPDPERFGVPRFDENKNIIEVVEKPGLLNEGPPPSSFAVTGLYIYDNTVFDRIRTLKPSERGELEISDVNNLYIKEGKLKWGELNGFWRDAGTFDTIYEVSRYWAEKKTR